MNNKNKKILTNKPLIFTKKVNENHKIIPLNTTTNTVGSTRYFPPAIKEWFNSIYSYNNNTIKNLSIADKNLSKLIKSYFNLYLSRKVLTYGYKRIPTRFRRLSLNRIFISKAELKHTSSKVIITLYVYNEERRILKMKLKNIERILFSGSELNNKNRSLSIANKLELINKFENSGFNKSSGSFLDYLEEVKLSILKIKQILTLRTENLVIPELLQLEKELNKIMNLVLNNNTSNSSSKNLNKNSAAYFYKEFLRKIFLEDEIKTIAYYKLLINLNKSKFEDNFLTKLKPLIAKIYNKEVEFNIINLKTLYFNSDIFTEAIAMKLKNRDNKLLRVLRSSLYMVKLPNVNSIRERYGYTNVNQIWENKVKNVQVNLALLESYKAPAPQNEDILNNILLEFLPNYSRTNNTLTNTKDHKNSSEIKNLGCNTLNTNTEDTIQDFILKSLKHKRMGGVRLEAKGRLTRRFTASRSVFKIRWKGSLKNIDSSYKGLSSVLLRGHFKSNLQYSIINSKTRNGSFGLKGWISSK